MLILETTFSAIDSPKRFVQYTVEVGAFQVLFNLQWAIWDVFSLQSFLHQFNALFILPVKFTQNRQNKQWHFYSTSKNSPQAILINHRLEHSHGALLKSKKFSGLCAQWQWPMSQCKWYSESTTHTTKYCNIFKKTYM